MKTSENHEAAFIAKITASATHELRNVLAIVKESAGLIEDMVNALDHGDSLEPDKFMRSASRIKAQVGRGAELISNLNRLAHSLDHAKDSLYLNQEVQLAAFLCARFARQKRQVVEVQSGEQDLTVVANSFRLQMSLFAALSCCTEQLPEAATITMRTLRHRDRPSVEFTGEAQADGLSPPPTAAPGWSRLQELLDSLGASVETVGAAYRFRVLLAVPDAV